MSDDNIESDSGHRPKKRFMAISVLVIILLILIPLPAQLLDILFALNLIFVLLTLLVVLKSKKANDFTLLPLLPFLFP